MREQVVESSRRKAWTLHACFTIGHLAVTRIQISIEWFRLYFMNMKKNIISLLSVLAFVCVGNVSCGDDEDTEEKVPFFSETQVFREYEAHYIEFDVPVNVGGEHTGHYETEKDYISFDVLEFHKDGSVFKYQPRKKGETAVPYHTGWYYNVADMLKMTYTLKAESTGVIVRISDGTVYTLKSGILLRLIDDTGRECYVTWDINEEIK